MNETIFNGALAENIQNESFQNAAKSLLENSFDDPKDISMPSAEETQSDSEQLARLYEEDQRRKGEQLVNTPEFKATVMFNNYVKSSPRILSGREKRTLFRECLRNAKKGRYDYIFDADRLRRHAQKTFEMHNKAKVLTNPTVDDIPKDVQETLLDMVDKEPWSDTESSE